MGKGIPVYNSRFLGSQVPFVSHFLTLLYYVGETKGSPAPGKWSIIGKVEQNRYYPPLFPS